MRAIVVIATVLFSAAGFASEFVAFPVENVEMGVLVELDEPADASLVEGTFWNVENDRQFLKIGEYGHVETNIMFNYAGIWVNLHFPKRAKPTEEGIFIGKGFFELGWSSPQGDWFCRYNVEIEIDQFAEGVRIDAAIKTPAVYSPRFYGDCSASPANMSYDFAFAIED